MSAAAPLRTPPLVLSARIALMPPPTADQVDGMTPWTHGEKETFTQHLTLSFRALRERLSPEDRDALDAIQDRAFSKPSGASTPRPDFATWSRTQDEMSARYLESLTPRVRSLPMILIPDDPT